MRFPFQADHAYYRRNRAYDFPQKDLKKRLTSAFLMLLTKIPAMRKEIYNKKMIEEMVKPVKKVVEKLLDGEPWQKTIFTSDGYRWTRMMISLSELNRDMIPFRYCAAGAACRPGVSISHNRCIYICLTICLSHCP